MSIDKMGCLDVASSFRRLARWLSDDVLPRREPGPRERNERNIDGKRNKGGDGIGNNDEERHGNNDGYGGMNGSSNGDRYRKDSGEDGGPGNLQKYSRGEVGHAREWETPTGNQQS